MGEKYVRAALQGLLLHTRKVAACSVGLLGVADNMASTCGTYFAVWPANL